MAYRKYLKLNSKKCKVGNKGVKSSWVVKLSAFLGHMG